MTRARLLELAARRARLQEQARAEREKLAALLGRADEASALVQRVRRLLAETGRQPLLVVAGAAFFIALRPRRAFKWLARGWTLWRLYRGARR